MKLVLLGTGGYFPTSRRQTACLMLPEIGVVLDAGTGMYRLGKHLQTDRLDIFLTHAHLDHVAGLTYLINRRAAGRAVPHTTVHGDAAKLAAVREHLFAEPIFPVAPPFRFEPLGGALALAARRHAHAFSAATSRRLARLSARLARPLAGLCDRHDGRRRCATTSNKFAASICWCTKRISRTTATICRRSPATARSERSPKLAAAADVGRLVLVHIDPQIDDDSAFDLDMRARTKYFRDTVEFGIATGMEIEF